MFTEYTVLRAMQEDRGNSSFASNFSYNHFRMAWYGFLQLLDIDLCEGFMCTTCGDHPDIVIMDATSLSFRKDFDPWKNLLNYSVKNETRIKQQR